MANEQNLMPIEEVNSRRTPEQHSADSAKGGIASGKTRRLQSAIKRALESKATSEEFNDIFEQFGIEEGDRDYSLAVACALVNKAAKGDLSAIGLMRDTIGEKPKEEIDLNGGVVIVDDITTSH